MGNGTTLMALNYINLNNPKSVYGLIQQPQPPTLQYSIQQVFTFLHSLPNNLHDVHIHFNLVHCQHQQIQRNLSDMFSSRVNDIKDKVYHFYYTPALPIIFHLAMVFASIMMQCIDATTNTFITNPSANLVTTFIYNEQIKFVYSYLTLSTKRNKKLFLFTSFFHIILNLQTIFVTDTS